MFFDGVTTTRNISAAPLQPAGYQLRFCRQQAGLGRRRVLQKFAHQFQRGSLVSFGLNQNIEDLALGVDGAPKIDHSAIDFQIDLIKMPRGARLRAALSQTGSDRRSEVIDPASNGLVGDRDPALCEQFFDVSKAQRKPDLEPNCLLYDLRREPVSGVADSRHTFGYRAPENSASP
jgi:hypothetical protein